MENAEQDGRCTGSSRSSGCMLTCCLCKRLPLDGAWLLPCLHNACRHCLDEQAATKGQQQQGDDGGQRVSCPECHHVAEVKSALRNDLVNHQVRQQNGLAEATVCCDACQENDVVDKPATVWCHSCTKALCAECVLTHDGYYKKHATEPLAMQTSSRRRAPIFRCSLHCTTCDFVCLTCQSLKCIDCWSDCSAGRHDMRRLTDCSVAAVVNKAKQNLARLERGLRSRALVLDKRQSLLRELRAAREEQLGALKTRKQRVVDAVEWAYAAAEKALKDTYDELEAKAASMERDAVSLDLQVRQAIEYCHYVAGVDDSACDLMLDQQRKVSSRIESLLADVNSRVPPLRAAQLVICDTVLPEDLREVMAAWIGLPMPNSDDLCRVKNEPQVRGLSTSEDLRAAGCIVQQMRPLPAAERQLQQLFSIANRLSLTTPPPRVPERPLVSAVSVPRLPPPPSTEEQQPLFFDAASSSFQVPVNCCLDIALTQDGYVLLAAREQGLREYSLRGLELRCWLPTALGISGGHGGDSCCDGRDAADEVRTVEALTGGRAAVGVYHCRLIVVLRRSTAGDEWLEERRLAVLQSSPNRMSACGDLIAVAGCCSCCGAGTGEERLEVVSLSGDEPLLYTRRAEYSLLSVAVTTSVVLTTSDGVVVLGDGRQACVVDCYGHRGGQHLWRYVAGDSEEVWDVCLGTASSDTASVAGVLVYLGVRRWDGGGESRVAAVRVSDGQQVKDDVLGGGGGKQQCRDSAPRCLFRLSVTKVERRAVLAVLNWVNKTVTVHPAVQCAARAPARPTSRPAAGR